MHTGNDDRATILQETLHGNSDTYQCYGLHFVHILFLVNYSSQLMR